MIRSKLSGNLCRPHRFCGPQQLATAWLLQTSSKGLYLSSPYQPCRLTLPPQTNQRRSKTSQRNLTNERGFLPNEGTEISCASAETRFFALYPYKYKYEVNRVLPLLENTQAAVTLGVNTKSDCFTPNSSVTVHVCKRILSLKGTKYCA